MHKAFDDVRCIDVSLSTMMVVVVITNNFNMPMFYTETHDLILHSILEMTIYNIKYTEQCQKCSNSINFITHRVHSPPVFWNAVLLNTRRVVFFNFFYAVAELLYIIYAK